jgi:Xaa-Pro dipeptidase
MKTNEHSDRIASIQQTLRNYHIDGWLLFNFRQSNIFASKLLQIPSHMTQMRRYFYYIPAEGEPQKVVHGIEQYNLDHLPGTTHLYVSWQTLHSALRIILTGVRTVAMEYSPLNAIPYVSKVDGGTVDLIRSFGCNVVTSGDIVQFYEARWTEIQRADQFETADILRRTVDVAFGFIGDNLRNHERITEYDVQQKMIEYFLANGLMYGDAPNCSVNGNAANPHYEPTKDIKTEIKKGDFILIDLWAKKNVSQSVYADITWIAFAGKKIPQKYQEVFSIVKGSRDAAVEYAKTALRSGQLLRGCDIDDVARLFIAQRGYGNYFIHRTGHNIGEEVHGNGANLDNLETNDQREILPETCFSVEPGIYLPDEFGVRLEINVYIDKNRTLHIPGQPMQDRIVTIDCGSD